MVELRVAASRRASTAPTAGVTADQLAARHIGQETRLPSLELTTALRGAQLSWRTPTQSLPQESNPRAVFYKLFGQGDTDAERAAIMRETSSILDRVTAQAHALQTKLGATRPGRGRRLPRFGPRDRAPRADGVAAGHERPRDSGRADRRAERHRRAFQADVRSDGARDPGRPHARRSRSRWTARRACGRTTTSASAKRSIRCRTTARIPRSKIGSR